MRPKYIGGIVLGCLMIYLGIFGLSGILYALTGSFFRDDFTVLFGWNMYGSPVIENGAVKIPGTTTMESVLYRPVSGVNSYQTVYAEAKIRIDVAPCRWYIAFTTGELTYLTFVGSAVEVATDTIGHLKSVGTFTLGVYATYTIKIDRTAQSYTVEKDGVVLGSGIIVRRTNWTEGWNIFFSSTEDGVLPEAGTMLVDYVEFGTGETTTPPPPNKASVTVVVSRWNGTGWEASVGASVIVKQSGTTVATWTTGSGGSTGSQQLDPGTYNFATSGAADSVNDTLSAGGTYTEQLWVGAANPNPPDPFAQIMAAIKAFFQNVYVKDVLLYGGIATTIVSAIVTVVPSKRKSPRPNGSRLPLYQ